MDIASLAHSSRDELITQARALGVDRPELMTRVELADEIVRRSEADPTAQRRARGWLGVARDLVASVVESGLNLPDAAAIIRGERVEMELKAPEPVATVTLAEIYAAQGHVARAIAMLDEVLGAEPDHEAAQQLRERLVAESSPRGGQRATPRTAPLPDLPASLDPAPLHVNHAQDSDEEGSRIAQDSALAESELEERAVDSAEPEASFNHEPAAEIEGEAAPEDLEELDELDEEPDLETIPARAAGSSVELADEVAVTASTTPDSVFDADVRPSPIVMIVRDRDADPVVCWDVGVALPEDAPLEILCVALSRESTSVEMNELRVRVTEQRGRAVLESVPAGAVLRATLGSAQPDGFAPIAIASEFRVEDNALRVTYRPPLVDGSRPTALESQLAATFAEL